MCVHDCIWHAWCQCLVCECVTNALVCARANALVRVCMRARANALICAPAYGMLACAVLRVAGACTPSLTSPDAERRPWTCVLERWRARARAVAARVEGCCTPTAAVCVCLCVCVFVCVRACMCAGLADVQPRVEWAPAAFGHNYCKSQSAWLSCGAPVANVVLGSASCLLTHTHIPARKFVVCACSCVSLRY